MKNIVRKYYILAKLNFLSEIGFLYPTIIKIGI